MDHCANGRASDAKEGIKHEVPWVRKGQYTALDELDRKLAWVRRLLWMVRLNVGDVPELSLPVFLDNLLPDVGRVLAKRVTRWLSLLVALEPPLAWVFA